MYTVPVWLVAMAGVWCGALYFFTRHVESIVTIPDSAFEGTQRPLEPLWGKVGCAMTALQVYVCPDAASASDEKMTARTTDNICSFGDFTLLGIFILGLVKQSSQMTGHSSYASAPVYAAAPGVSDASLEPTTHLLIKPPLQVTQQFVPPPAQQQQQYQQPPQPQPYHYHHHHHQQQHQYQYPYQYQQAQHQPQPITAAPTIPTPDLKPPPPSQPPTPTPPPPPGRQSSAAAHSRLNRVDAIRRLCALQHPDGHWDHSPELAELVRQWSGRDLTLSPARPGATALAHACLTDLCNTVWTAQREGREHECLGADELASLQAVHWDLGWAKHALDRAAAWMAAGVGVRS